MRQNVAPTSAGHDPRITNADDSIAADLELVAKKLADVTRKATRDRDMEAVFAAASAEHDRRARETAEKTAAALDSVAQWVERTEGRLSDTARQASEGQERTAGMLNDAVGLMTRRLDEIERKITDSRQPSMDAAITAVQRIEAQMEKLGQDGRGQAHSAQIEAALRGVEERIAQVSERITHGGAARDSRGKHDPRSGLTSAIEEIRSRQSELEEPSARIGVARSQTELLRSLRDDFSRLSGQLDGGRPTIGTVEAASGLREEIDNLRQSVGGLATRQEINALEHAIQELSRQIGVAREVDRDLTGIAGPLAAVQAEVRRLSDTVTADVEGRAALDLQALSRKLDSIVDRGVSPALVERLSADLGEVRGLVRDMADPQRVRNLAEQVAGLNHQVAQVRRQFGNSDFSVLTSTVDEIRTAVNARAPSEARHNEHVARELERLSGHIEGALAAAGTARGVETQLERLSGQIEGALTAAGNPAGVDLLIERLDSLNENLGRSRRDGELKPIEDMLRGLAEKIDQTDRHGGDLDGIETQIGLLAERIEHSSHQPVLASLERSMGDLLAQMARVRTDTAETAERAVRSAIIHTLQSLPKGTGGPDVGALQDELADLKASQDEAGKWTQDTFSAVHVTLDKVVSRLASLDFDVAPERPEPKPAAAPAHEAPPSTREAVAPSAREPEPRPAREPEAPAPKPIPSSKQVEESLRKLEAELVPHLSAGPAANDSVRELPPEDEILLEPGEARPFSRETPAATTVANSPTIEVSDIKASFIAAARRAAQAAASEAAVNNDKGGARRSKAARHGAFGREGGSLAGQLKHSLDERRRPILLGVAAILLALGAVQVGNTYYGGASKPTIMTAVRNETKAPPTAPSRELVASSTAMIDAADPRTTAGIGADATSPQKLGAPPQPLADTAARERDAAFGDPKSAARLDTGKPAPNDGSDAIAPAQQTLERIPNMASVGPIPANAGPASLRQAAITGDPAAVFELASRAAEGRGMNRDLALAARLFEKAAAHGLVPAQYRTGNAYEKGLGVNRDLVVAKSWYQRAADKGNARAMHNLAVMIAEGVGGKPDYATAIAWFRRAAQHGIRDSQFNLAVLLARGLGTAQDLSGSYTWFAIVAAQGDEDAVKKRDEVAGRLGAAELASAKLAVERWRPDTPDTFANDVAQPPQGWTEAPQAKRTASNGRI